MTEQKIEQFWRDATAGDVARVMKGEKVEARFRDSDKEGWICSFLKGWAYAKYRSDDGWAWDQCQIYDPPQWWIDKPYPGEGYRLLEKFPDEPKGPDDEEWDASERLWKWNPLIASHYDQRQATWYRRRIEPVKQDAGSTCASNIPKGWTALLLDEPRLASDAYWSLGAKDWIIIGDARLESSNREKWPAIRRVENQISMKLMADCCYTLPSGHSICVTEKGFEVLL